MIHERYKLSVALFAYNQEAYVREAVKSLLNQETTKPLEIILSDDCSPDGTFAILKEEVDAYSGEHQIILRRNETNLGIGAHVREILKLATGDLVIMAAGDDISLPNRAQRIAEAWLDLGRPDGVFSNGYTINEDSEVISDSVYEWKPVHLDLFRRFPTFKTQDYIENYERALTLGATSAWSRQLWEAYPAINSDVVNEDDVFSFRAGLGRGIRFLDEPLVKRRIHSSNFWGGRLQPPAIGYKEALALEREFEWRSRAKLAVLRQALVDISYCLDAQGQTEALLSAKQKLSEKLEMGQRVCDLKFGSYKSRVRGFTQCPRISGVLGLLPVCIGIRLRAIVKIFLQFSSRTSS